jgi:hypothetical protein
LAACPLNVAKKLAFTFRGDIMIKAGFTAVVICLLFAACSGPGGNSGAMPPRPGAITFSGESITGNVMTLPCDETEDFMISQTHFSGTFTVVSSSSNLTVDPGSGTASTTFSAYSADESSATWSITATGGGGKTGTLTVDYTGCDDE